MRLFILFITIFLPTIAQATTYYIRTDGGSASQCSGLTDAPYTSGTDCAWNHPYEALGVIGSSTYIQRIAGGDTVIIKNGSYRMGYTAGVYASNSCSSSWSYDCVPNSPPAGTTEKPTKILGEGWDTGCTTAPELYGVEKTKQVISLFSTSNIEMQCLEITDHEDCSANQLLDASVRCPTTFPYGDIAQRGIEFRNVQNLYMKNINIHGITGPGIRGAEVTNMTIEDSKISYNNAGGINGETPAQTPNQFYGDLVLNNVEVAWNGCVEAYPTDGALVDGGCVGGNNGGFGDGIGLAETGGNWVFDNCSFIGNVEDGLDLLYMRTLNGTSKITNSHFEHNGGNALKVGTSSVIANNVLIGDCDYFDGKSIVNDVTSCRGNATLSITLQRNNASTTVVNNTFTGQSDIMLSTSSSTGSGTVCDGSERLFVANNIFVGGTYFQDPTDKLVDATYIYNTCEGFASTITNNVYYNTKDGENDCVTSPNSFCQDPLFVSFDEATNTYDVKIQSTSPAIDKGLASGTSVGFNVSATTIPATDKYGATRTTADIGMFEWGGEYINSPYIKKIIEN